MTIQIQYLGQKPYLEVLELQHQLRERRLAGQIPDTLILVEHPKVITQGVRSEEKDFLIPPEKLKNQGFEIHSIKRGGRLTYHGPGQLVFYFIFSLSDRNLKVPQMVRLVEELGIRLCNIFGVQAFRKENCPGLWVKDQKIASLGLHIHKGVSMHGMALNINTNLQNFDTIIPCGLTQTKMTSLKKELGKTLNINEVVKEVSQQVKVIFSS